MAMIAILLISLPAHAQFSTGDELTLSISPDNPRPYDTVTITPASNLINLAASLITVSVNGKVVETGTGIQSVPITVGGPGEQTVVSVSANTGGQTYTSRVGLRPADVSLIVEPTSITHPFYLGAPLVAPSGRVRIIALADLRTSPSTRINPAALVYTWKQGDQILQGSSGIGRSVLVATAPVRYRDAQITVSVSNVDSTLVAEASTAISPVDPVARIYHTDALMGTDFDHALVSNYTMPGAEDAFRAVAYYFGAAPSLAWAVNGQSVSTGKDVTVRSTGSGAGNATLTLSAKNVDSTQSATVSLPIRFGESGSSNIFGF